LEFAPLGEGGI
jgi:hypothetical protein